MLTYFFYFHNTVGEMMQERTPLLCGDAISTGLDAASTFNMVELMIHVSRMTNTTRVISLLQPPPETVSLFDEVILLAEGRIIYAGPIEEVEDYFGQLGYQTPDYMDVADFLQQVATEDGAKFYHPSDSVRELRPNAPTVPELAALFRKSEYHKRIQKNKREKILERVRVY